MSHELLDSVTNSNGGGLSVEVTGKYTSVRHERARLDGKMTAGDGAKLLKKQFKISLKAKELTEAFQILTGREPEWHHAGFYKNGTGKSRMGRTFFFSSDDIELVALGQDKIAAIKLEREREREIAKNTIVTGIYFSWESDYSGAYGKKRNFKVLGTYQGSELGTPTNFTSSTEDQYQCAKLFENNKRYMGWDEPSPSEFSAEVFQAESERRERVEMEKKTKIEKTEKELTELSIVFEKADHNSREAIKSLILNGNYGSKLPRCILEREGIKLDFALLPRTESLLKLGITNQLNIYIADYQDLPEHKKAEEDEKNKVAKLAAKIESLKSQGLPAYFEQWKMDGCTHPAPAEVLALKNASGMNWKMFQNLYGKV